MSGGRNSEALSIASLALEIHRQPARHAELLRGFAPLPPGVSVLLRLAGGTALEDLDPRLASLAPESELRRSALFFIEQVLFQRDASHYRVLGLSPAATAEQIKEHHRLLMRLFHPDRDTQLGETREHYATRANLAYNTLRDADSRADYDAALKPQAVHTAPVQVPSRTPRRPSAGGWRRMPEPDSFWSVRVHPLLMRYLPQWVLAGTALASVAVVGAVYLFNPPAPVTGPVFSAGNAALAGKPDQPPDARDARAEVAAVNIAPLDDVAEQFKRRMAEAGEAPAAADSQDPQVTAVAAPAQDAAKETVKEAAVPRQLPAPQPQAKLAPAAPAKVASLAMASPAPALPARDRQKSAAAVVAVPAEPVSAKPPKPETAIVAAPAVIQQSVAETARPTVAAAAAPAPAVEPPPRPLPDPNALLSRFLEAYEHGDIQTCMSLLDDGLRTDAGGKPELRREYDVLFRSTDLRHVRILNMNWSRDGEFIRGEGRYRATQMRKGESMLRTQDGQVRVELIRRGGAALINELYYLSGRS